MSSDFYHHPDSRILSVSGGEAADFLNDLLTSQIQRLELDTARLACLLSPQGRILFDMMVIRISAEKFYLICDIEQLQPLLKKLKLYRLRRKIELNEETGWVIGHRLIAEDKTDEQDGLYRRDERHSALGWYCLLTLEQAASVQMTDDQYWQELRIATGIPQGAQDLTPNRALMLEAGLEHLGGIDFKKGCYIGQEVTARTHYRGLVKRRIVPVRTTDTKLSTGDAVFWEEKEVGKILSVAGNSYSALASIRLDALQDCLNPEPEQAAGHISDSSGYRLELSIPQWMHPLPFK